MLYIKNYITTNDSILFSILIIVIMAASYSTTKGSELTDYASPLLTTLIPMDTIGAQLSVKDRYNLNQVSRNIREASQHSLLPKPFFSIKECGEKYDKYIEDNNLTNTFFDAITQPPYKSMRRSMMDQLFPYNTLYELTEIQTGGNGTYWDVTLSSFTGVVGRAPFENSFGCDFVPYQSFLKSKTYQDRMTAIIIPVLKFFKDNRTEHALRFAPFAASTVSLDILDFMVINIMVFAYKSGCYTFLSNLRYGHTMRRQLQAHPFAEATLLYNVWHRIYKKVLKEFKPLYPDYVPNLKNSGMPLHRIYEEMRTQEGINTIWQAI